MLTMIAALKRLGRDQRGVSIVETALWLPLVAMAGLGGLEYTNFVLANQKLERIASVSADTIARNTIAPSENSFKDVFKAVDQLDAPFDVKEYGRVILTGVIGVNQDGEIVNKVVWQRCTGKKTTIVSQIGAEWTQTDDFGEGPDVTLPNNVVLQQNQMVVVAEVGFEYKPLINVANIRNRASDGIIRQRSMFVTRGQAIPNITPVAGVVPSRC
ncbi:pilus assembly protein [Sphingomonas sp. ID1715]|uniref:TadE/TadG family type IV pilus assembly protein n=1 Tax=Sphingomonas sp. ID1715 TaxID=1656898 RepID=UPI0014892601|nr:TadE/TadG family type IV pilus assembly protein [Sphingomonas sp. ID1715]NNM77934.1 pilus assembly protein [Sphingomonas sp. ID1715]